MIEVLRGGHMSSIQDKGRFGFRHLGVPLSGTMDTISARMANLLIDNEEGDAVIEIGQIGIKLLFHAPSWFSLTGASRKAYLNGRSTKCRSAKSVKKGDLLEIKSSVKGTWSYLALKGGIPTEIHLNSRSSYHPASLGTPYLKKGDYLRTISFESSFSPITNSKLSLPKHFNQVEIRVAPGPEFQLLNNLESLIQKFIIGANSNRMAYLLESNRALEASQHEIITAPVCPGTIQLPPSGVPMVLMRDAQTTGGYPRILQVLNEDLNALAQKRAGEPIKLKIVRS